MRRLALSEWPEVGNMHWVTANLYAAAVLSEHGRKDEALRLSVTADVFKKQAPNIYRKLNVSDRYEDVAIALTGGILRNRQ